MEVSGGLKGGFSLWTSRKELEKLRRAGDSYVEGSSLWSVVLSSETPKSDLRSSLEAESEEVSL